MLQQPYGRHEPLRSLSDDELSRIIVRCENAIAEGTAEVGDYEAFVLAQKELVRRTWSA